MNPFHPSQNSIPAPVTQGKAGRGYASQVNLDAGKLTAVVRYKDKLSEADIYALEGAPLKVIFRCPRCGHDGTINGDHKAIAWSPHEPQRIETDGEVFLNCGELSVEPFECAWEMPDAGAHTAGLVTAGTTLCRLVIGIDKNVAKDG